MGNKSTKETTPTPQQATPQQTTPTTQQAPASSTPPPSSSPAPLPVGPTTTYQIQGADIPVTSDPSVTEAQLANFLNEYVPFQEWLKRLNHGTRFRIRKLHLQTVDMFGPRIGFAKFKLDVVNEEGRVVPGIVFMRGAAVSVLVILRCENKEYTLLTVQPRVPLGDFECIELPAGMIDQNSGDFAGVAAKEMKEETGLSIPQDHLIDMCQLAWGDRFPGLLPSPGGCDEFLRLYLYTTDIGPEELHNLEGKATGILEEGEIIKLKVVPLEDLWKISADCKALSSLLLYENLKQAGRLPEQKSA